MGVNVDRALSYVFDGVNSGRERVSYPPQPPGPYGNQPEWGQQPSGYYPQDQSQDFWRQVAAGSPPPPSPPPPPKRQNNGMIIGLVALGLALLVSVGVTVVVLTNNNNQAGDNNRAGDNKESTGGQTTTQETTETKSGSGLDGTIEVGECLNLLDETGGPVEEAKCASPESDYEVVEVLGFQDVNACPDNYSNAWRGRTYCMILDVEVGDCLSSFNETQEVLPMKADCSAPNTEDQVTKVEPRATPKMICAPKEGFYVFDVPARTVCFGDVQGT